MEFHFSEWLQASGVLVLMFLVIGGIRAILGRISQNRTMGSLKLARELGPSISNLAYIVGLMAFVEVAPLTPKVAHWLESAVYILGIVLVLSLLRRAALVGIEWGAARTTASPTLQQGFIPLVRNLITLFVFLTGGIMVLKHFNYDVMSLVTALGVGSLAVGLAAKDTMTHMFSGFTLIIDRNLRPGDRVNVGGSTGTVEEIGLRSTQIKLGDGNMLIVPNTDLVNNRIINLSMPTSDVICSTQIRVPFSTSFERIKAICLETAGQTSKARSDKGRWANLASLQDGHQLIQVGFWVSSSDDSGGALSEFHERLLARLAAEQIELVGPLPAAASR